ncbi:MAG: DUF3313 domain-containing protein [Planctomycetota bacterium]|nr:DUF3313 domain-containing protein [Planctomycetota bacterium]
MSTTIARSILSAALLPAAMVVIAGAAGCAEMPKSGFLSDYAGFEEAPEDAPIWEYVDPEHKRRERLHARIWRDIRNWRAIRNYDRVMVDPVVVQLKSGSAGKYMNPQRVSEMAQYMHDTLVDALQDRYPIVDEPGEGVLRFRTAITDVFPEIVYITQDADKQPVKNWANSTPGGAGMEGEAIDSVTGERILGLITSVRGSHYETFEMEPGDRLENAKEAIAGIARAIRDLMDEAHEPHSTESDAEALAG